MPKLAVFVWNQFQAGPAVVLLRALGALPHPPEDKPARTLRGPQEENPQVVVHQPGRQSGDAKGTNAAGSYNHYGGGGEDGGEDDGEGGNARDAAARVDEQKRNDVAGGFGVGRRSKL
ncbi:hypothetical protein C8Q80DRAFT_1269468 [Daedaleopsis nitida]|nr:hypothetical protein C8Q80DRAFT_1269468 [Daedaleopsis nitida]